MDLLNGSKHTPAQGAEGPRAERWSGVIASILPQVQRLRRLRIVLTSSLWFVPSVLVIGAIALATLLTLADLRVGHAWTLEHPVLFGVGASGARGMLSAIAGSMMTVASLTFSLTISTLATASSQYSSRLVRNFMRDRVNQFMLGYFVGLFGYCLVVLRTIRGGDEGQFVPSIAVMGGLVLAIASIGVLIFFIHHIAESIQAGTILRRVTAETLVAIDELFPASEGEPARGDDAASEDDPARDPAPRSGPSHPVLAGSFGYVRSLDAATLLTLAADHDAVVRMSVEVGAFVTPGGALCELSLRDEPDAALTGRVRAAFDLGPMRTVEQDAAFGVRQLVDIALKALSPGVNDTTTGVMCVEHLGVLLEALASRAIPDRLHAKDGVVRVVVTGRSFDALVGLCLDQVRQSAGGNTAVLEAILRAIALAGRQTAAPARRRTLTRHAELVEQVAAATIAAFNDREPLLVLAARVRGALGQ